MLGLRLTATQSRLPGETYPLADTAAGSRRRGARLERARRQNALPAVRLPTSIRPRITPVAATALWVAVKRRRPTAFGSIQLFYNHPVRPVGGHTSRDRSIFDPTCNPGVYCGPLADPVAVPGRA